MSKIRLDQYLCQNGLVQSRERAKALIMSGIVFVNEQKVDKAGEMIAPDAKVEVRGHDIGYVSRGGLKLEKAMQVFPMRPDGKVCMDIGASTGGFTDCLVKSGAALVYAVDVGFGQLMGSLRQDPHVVNLERTNISDEKLLSLDPKPTLGSVDLSYLSLRKGIPAFAAILKEEGELMCLVKPLFETEDAAARRSGVLPDDAYEGVLNDLIRDVNALPYAQAVNVTHSPVTGNAGTREFFLHVRLGWDKGPAVDLAQKARQAVERALQLSLYEKNNG